MAQGIYKCPYCKEHIHLDNHFIYRAEEGTIKMSHCSNSKCGRVCSWCDGKMISPAMPPPHADLPNTVKKAYQEAAFIIEESPRCAAILLRLAVELICDEQKCKGRNLEEKIKKLVKKPKFPSMANALMVGWFAGAIRVVGNESVHNIDFEINKRPKTVEHMFEFINYIAEVLYPGIKIGKPSQTHETSLKNETPKKK